MELTRRDALAALGGVGVALGGSAAALSIGDPAAIDPALESVTESGTDGVSESNVAGIAPVYVAVAEAIYPSSVTGIEAFVRTYLEGRFERTADRTAVRETVGQLDELADGWHGASIVDLDPETRERLLREVGANTATANPSGTIAERVRYHVIDELQYALYASPTGGKLVGIENPIGHPGGIDSYRQGPSR